MRSCYLFADSVAEPDSPRLQRLLDNATAAGLDTVVTKAEAVTAELAAKVHARGLRLLGSVACFRGPEGPLAIGNDGRPFEPMEWYTGVRPNDPAWNAALVARCAQLSQDAPVDGLILDFLRWPLHWELELRPGARPRSASYDRTTLAQFAKHSGIRLQSQGADAARLIARRHAEAWTGYRTHVISTVARTIRDAVRAQRPELWLGAFLVPCRSEEERRTVVGQDGEALGTLLDGLLPMTYHGIVHRPPAWVADVTMALTRASRTSVTAMVQTTADAAAVTGGTADWGDPVSITGFAEALRHALRAAEGRFCLFPGEGLTAHHWRTVRAELEPWNRSRRSQFCPL